MNKSERNRVDLSLGEKSSGNLSSEQCFKAITDRGGEEVWILGVTDIQGET